MKGVDGDSRRPQRTGGSQRPTQAQVHIPEPRCPPGRAARLEEGEIERVWVRGGSEIVEGRPALQGHIRADDKPGAEAIRPGRLEHVSPGRIASAPGLSSARMWPWR